MTWVRLPDELVDSLEIERAGPLAGWLYVCGLSYANRGLTDGFIPASRVSRLGALDNPDQLAQRLVDAGLWQRTDGGFQIVGYHRFQPSAATVRAHRDEGEQRKVEGRAKGFASVRRNGRGRFAPASTAQSGGVSPLPGPARPGPAPSQPDPAGKQQQHDGARPMVDAVYRDQGAEVASLTGPLLRRELTIARGLLAAGATAEEAQRFVAWWRAGPGGQALADLRVYERHRSAFLAGSAPPGPNGHVRRVTAARGRDRPSLPRGWAPPETAT